MKYLKLITRLQAKFIWGILMFVLPFGIMWIYNHLLPHGKTDRFDGTEMISALVSFISYFVIIILSGILVFDDENNHLFKSDYKSYSVPTDEEEKSATNGFKKFAYILVGLFIVYSLYNLAGKHVTGMVNVYNQSKLYQNTFEQKEKERVGNYDKLWKTFLQKDKITNINKETFLQVSKIIMENRADGQNVTWKWVNENTQIPYSQFTAFYADLSEFIEYYQLELQCQQVSVDNNIMLDTFPNNIYNKVLGCKHINFSYGFLSDSTNKVFATKKENIEYNEQ